MIRIHKEFNVETGEETIIEREETKEEKAERLAFESSLAKLKAEEQALEDAKLSVAAKLGLTLDELKIALS